MFPPKLLKYAVAGGVCLFILGSAAFGISKLSKPAGDLDELGDPNYKSQVTVIDEHTEILIEQWCPICYQRFTPASANLYREWYGMTRSQVEQYLDSEHPGANIVAFFKDQVVVHMPPGRCPDCKDARWPSRGYIGVVDGTKMAVFTEDGRVYEVLDEAPGAWIEELEKGIPFESPTECEELIINLTS